MLNKKYNKTLTVLLVIAAIAVFALFGFWGYKIYEKYYKQKQAEQAIEQWDNQIERKKRTTNPFNLSLNDVYINVPGSDSDIRASMTYKGFTMLGYIEIPKINLKLPVLARSSERALKVSVCYHFGAGLNRVGNTVIYGHNYRDGTFFSNLNQVANDDLVYITDETGTRIPYKVYNVYQTTPEDADYFYRDTQGKREISLSTCTDDVSYRTIVWARETEE